MQQDYGSIECTAKNSVGIQQTPCAFHIVPAGPPSFPFHCQSINSSQHSLAVSCIYQSRPVESISGPTVSHTVASSSSSSSSSFMFYSPSSHYSASHLMDLREISSTAGTSAPSHRSDHSMTNSSPSGSLPPAALYVYPSTLYICEVYLNGALVSNQSVALPLPYQQSVFGWDNILFFSF